MESAAKIKEILQAAELEKLPDFIAAYQEDPRNGVQKLVALAQKKLDALEKEKQRIENLKKYEKEYAGYTYICGIDEVGRGPLAGPVVAGAVIYLRTAIFSILMIPSNYPKKREKNCMM